MPRSERRLHLLEGKLQEVACVLALGNISDRMEKGLSQQIRDFLAGAHVLCAARPVDEDWLQTAQQQGLTVSRQVSFMTITYAGEQAPLARVNAADDRYPLYGQLLTRPEALHTVSDSVLVAP